MRISKKTYLVFDPQFWKGVYLEKSENLPTGFQEIFQWILYLGPLEVRRKK